MKYSITDYIVSIFITILVYDTVPLILILLGVKLKIWMIRVISIVNYLIGILIFSYYNFLATGSIRYSTGAAFIWTIVGYWLMCKYCKTNSTDKFSDTNRINNIKDTSEVTVPLTEKKSKHNYPFIVCIIIIILLIGYSCYCTYKSYVQKEALSILADKYKNLNDKNSELQSQLDALTLDYNNLENAYEVVYKLYKEYYPFADW